MKTNRLTASHAVTPGLSVLRNVEFANIWKDYLRTSPSLRLFIDWVRDEFGSDVLRAVWRELAETQLRGKPSIRLRTSSLLPTRHLAHGLSFEEKHHYCLRTFWRLRSG